MKQMKAMNYEPSEVRTTKTDDNLKQHVETLISNNYKHGKEKKNRTKRLGKNSGRYS